MRITNSMMVRSTLRDLNLSYARLARTQEQLSSGRQLVRASDDPAVAADAMRLRALTRRSEQYARSLNDAQGLLGSADGALTSSLERLERAKELAVRAASSGGLSDPNARKAMAIEIRAIRDDLIALANTRHGERSVFAGNAAGAAFTAAGVYDGDDGAVRRDVAANTSVQVNVTGTDAFGVEIGWFGRQRVRGPRADGNCRRDRQRGGDRHRAHQLGRRNRPARRVPPSRSAVAALG